MSNALYRVKSWIEEQRLLPDSGLVIAGLSGGADSMAMAHMLHQLLPAGRLVCAHINHGIRGEAAERDQAFVEDWCRKEGIPLQVLRANVPEEAKKTGEGLEACGRRVRYAFFQSLSLGENDRIATAHTRSDQAETVLLHLVQGAGARGLSGIPTKRENIIRPVLCLSREEIEEYCRENHIQWCTDATNEEIEYTRNRIRHQVLPLLRDMNPSIEETLERTAFSLKRDADCLEEMAQKSLEQVRVEKGLSVKAIQALPEAVAVRVLARYFQEQGCPRPETVHLEQALTAVQRGGGRLSVPGGFEVSIWSDLLRIEKREKVPFSSWEVPIRGHKTLLEDGRWLIMENFPVSEMKKRIKFHNLLFPILLDYDTITHSQNLLIRTRRAGDRFSPAGRGISKSLKKLFSEERVPIQIRDHLAVLESNGELLWVETFGVCHRCRLRPETKRVLLLYFQPEENKLI